MKVGILLLIFCPGVLFSQLSILQARIIKGKDIVTNTSYRYWQEDKSSQTFKAVITNNENQMEFGGKNLQGVNYSYFSDTAGKFDIKSVRTGNKIESEGLVSGKKIKKISEIDNAPWYASFEQAAQDMLGTEEKTKEFWMVTPGTLDTMKMSVNKGSEKTIEIDGKVYRTIQVEVSLAGPLSMFWKSSYWFEIKSPYRFVRFKGLMGPPGSPEVTVELISRKILEN